MDREHIKGKMEDGKGKNKKVVDKMAGNKKLEAEAKAQMRQGKEEGGSGKAELASEQRKTGQQRKV